MRFHSYVLGAGLMLGLLASGRGAAAADTVIHSWQFEEASGDTTADSGTPGGAPGTLGASAIRTSPGLVGNGGIRFASRFGDDYVDFGTTVAAFGTSDFTISVRLTTTFSFFDTNFEGVHGEVLGTRDDSSGGNYIGLRLNVFGQLNLEIRDDTGGSGTMSLSSATSGVTVNDGQPHLVSFTRTGSVITFSIDGNLVDSGDSGSVINITNDDGSSFGPNSFRLGRFFACCGNFENAQFEADDLRILVPSPDADGDGVVDASDNCPTVANGNQANNDEDALGDACDDDDDNDDVLDGADNCQFTSNPGQADGDDDGQGDACDSDDDGDTVPDDIDNCPTAPNADQLDTDGDTAGDDCDADDDNDGLLDDADNCPTVDNPAQTDTDGDQIGNACDADDDNDGDLDGADNCPLTANPDQGDFDGDGLGDACDPDADGDGVGNATDICPFTLAGETVDPSTGCSIGQLCPTTGPRGTSLAWRNHGQYVSCVATSTNRLVAAGLLTPAQRDAIVSAAAQSNVGK